MAIHGPVFRYTVITSCAGVYQVYMVITQFSSPAHHQTLSPLSKGKHWRLSCIGCSRRWTQRNATGDILESSLTITAIQAVVVMVKRLWKWTDPLQEQGLCQRGPAGTVHPTREDRSVLDARLLLASHAGIWWAIANSQNFSLQANTQRLCTRLAC